MAINADAKKSLTFQQLIDIFPPETESKLVAMLCDIAETQKAGGTLKFELNISGQKPLKINKTVFDYRSSRSQT